jgi:glucosyl-3-phosphoglycerate synthase
MAAGSTTVAVCLPAHDEAATIGPILRAVLDDLGPLVDELVVVDDGSADGTAAVAEDAGVRVVTAPGSSPGAPRGKGVAMQTGIDATSSDLLVFLDADVSGFGTHFVTRLVDALVADDAAVLAKATYRRPLHGLPDEGGRVNALLARPLLRRCYPELAHLHQPLAGECAVRRRALDGIVLEPGYGVEVGLLIDIAAAHGATAIIEVDLGERRHRNRPLGQLEGHADAIVAALLDRWCRRA